MSKNAKKVLSCNNTLNILIQLNCSLSVCCTTIIAKHFSLQLP